MAKRVVHLNSEDLRQQWKALYRDRLPAAAIARDPAQKQWPILLDHCFARLILDNAVGKDRPWDSVVKAPATTNMTDQQLRAAIAMGEDILSGKVNVSFLNHVSLSLRDKSRKRPATQLQREPAKKSTRTASHDVRSFFAPVPDHGKGLESEKREDEVDELNEMDVQIRRIATSNMTPFSKLALSTLCQIPKGRYSTYQTIADHITRKSHKTCARAVGNAMRNNPFAPEVPCHRVLASDGTLGGFKGSWGEGGKFATHKHALLQGEGVAFDSAGKVKGPPFRGFYLKLQSVAFGKDTESLGCCTGVWVS